MIKQTDRKELNHNLQREMGHRRSSWAYDNLNRMTANGAGTSATNDILGNRTALGSSVSYSWDSLNRMTGYNAGTAYSYAYRVDGIRVSRAQSSLVDHYRYDGQIPIETSQTIGTAQTIANGLGARGIDYTAITTGSGTSVMFPLYDAHGNQVATLARSGSSYTISNQRSFGAWGEIRQGSTSGDPKGRYCGSLGHVQDDESGLIYMRARYYELTSGRFISEDPGRSEENWFSYCGGNPVSGGDPNGRAKKFDIQQFERWIEELFEDGKISEKYWEKFCDKSSGLRRWIHNQITRQSMSKEDVQEFVEADCKSKEYGEVLGDTEELEGDFEAGEDTDLILLEEEVVESEVVTGLIE